MSYGGSGGGFTFLVNPPVDGVNLFSGADQGTAEAARDSYFSDPAKLAWYEVNIQRLIILVYGGKQYMQNRRGGIWVDSFNSATSAIDLSTISATELLDIDGVGSRRIISTDERTKLEGLEPADEVFDQIDNTSDADKPISDAQALVNASKIDEAPNDGERYVRANENWVELEDAADTRVDWMLDTDVFEAPSIAYQTLNMEVNSTGSYPVYVLGGTEPIQGFRVVGTLPSELTLDITTGELSYVTSGSVGSGTFDVIATNPVGDSEPFTVQWEVSAGKGVAQFTNSESYYPFLRISTSNSDNEQVLLKQTFFGRTAGTSNPTIIEDPTCPIYAASNGDGTWNYFMKVTGYTYWLFYKNSATDPSTLANGLNSDLRTSLTYDLVSPTSDDITFNGVTYPADQSDVHYGTGLKHMDFGTPASLDGFLADDTDWSFGFKLVDAIPEDGLGRTMFTREGRNWLAFYIGHNSTYTNILVGNGSNKSYSGETTFPSGGFSVGDYIRVTGKNGVIKIFRNGTQIFSKSSSSYLDSATSVNSLPITFGNGVLSNDYQSSYSYYHGKWQGNIERMWIANGSVENTDDTGTVYPSGATHTWAMDETTGSTFTSTLGGVTAQGV